MAHLEQRPQPYTFDVGTLLCNDTNPLPALGADKEAVLAGIARENAQALINQLLTTCPITKSTDADGGLQINLPPPTTHLPREKPVPKDKEKTKWERFAEKKGIKAKKRDGKLAFDEASGEWKAKYGYKGKRGDGVQEDWIVEDDGKDGEDGGKKKKNRKK